VTDAQQALKVIRDQRDNPNLPVPSAWNSQYALRKYQRVAVSYLLVMKRFVLGHCTGAGKTVCGLNAWGIFREQRPSRLFVVTTKSAVSQWGDECARFLPGVPCIAVPSSEDAPNREREHYYQEWVKTGLGSMLCLSWSQYQRDWEFFLETQDLWKEGTWVILDECLYRDQTIRLLGGRRETIFTVVNDPTITHVESWNFETKCWEARKILNKFSNSRRGRKILRIYPDSGSEEIGSLTCSENHILLRSDGSRVMAGDLRVGDQVTVRAMQLTDQQSQIVFGSLLGDSSLSRESKSWRFIYKHSDAQKGFFDWKHRFLRSLGSADEPQERFNGGWGDIIWERPTYCLNALEEVAEITYSNRGEKGSRSTGAIKTISAEWLNKIDVRGLAIWFCDDGSAGWYTYYSDRKLRGQDKHAINGERYCAYIHFSTHNFTYQENQTLQQWLRDRWGVPSEIMEDSKDRGHGYFLAVWAEHTQKFIDLVKDYVPTPMKYKVDGQGADLWGEVEYPQMGLTQIKVERIRELSGIKHYDCDTRLFTIEVEGNHNYCAGGFLVENCQRVRNPKSKLYGITQQLSEIVPRIHGFTATLIKNKAHDALHILNLLNPGTMSPVFFNRTYVIQGFKKVPMRTGKGGGRRFITVKTIEGYKNLQDFAVRVSHLYLSPPESEMDLERPEVQTVSRRETMSSLHRRIYTDAERGLFLAGCESDAMAASSALAHAQIAASTPEHFVDLSLPLEADGFPSVFHTDTNKRLEYKAAQEKNSKLAMLKDLLSTELEDDPVIVYSPFATSIWHLSSALANQNPVVITGSVKQADRDQARLDFQGGKSNLMLMTDAGGEALNLQRAKHVIFYSLSWTVGQYVQVVGRARRFGSEHQYLGVWHLLMRDSVDELVESILRPKALQFEVLLSSNEPVAEFQGSLAVEVARRMRKLRIAR
jgi:superfamily II DNA or RNA helicase